MDNRRDIKIEINNFETTKNILRKRRLEKETIQMRKIFEEEYKIKSESESEFKGQTISELISELLIFHKNGYISFEHYETGAKKVKKIDLNEEALEYYNNLQVGDRTYLINGLLRTWIKRYDWVLKYQDTFH